MCRLVRTLTTTYQDRLALSQPKFSPVLSNPSPNPSPSLAPPSPWQLGRVSQSASQSETYEDGENLGEPDKNGFLGQIERHGEEHHIVLPHLLPVLVRIDLLPITNVPEEDDYGRHDRDYGPDPLVIPLHVVEEETDSLTITRVVVLTVEEFLRKLVEELHPFGLPIIQGPNLVVDSWIVLEGDCVEGHVHLEVLVAHLDGRPAKGTLLRVRQEEA